ncbi:LOW QUALITY PROTEIN: hypothetical protein M8C21_030221 [Ambrosia artemisiifolia]|uniref:Uncharacterized protein n=1 Tax=Ambrosia artemisiifolia TaxID=4212 RepID=A0AAD5GHW2_AMBAR|nr:LOW QUALITY PROTEIN: hypothetical protein M8C21_030221 [Ambrosia artemisiifolia]
MVLNANHDTEIESFRASAVDSDVKDGVIQVLRHHSSLWAMHNLFKGKLKFLVTDTVGPDSSSTCIRVSFNSRSNTLTTPKPEGAVMVCKLGMMNNVCLGVEVSSS